MYYKTCPFCNNNVNESYDVNTQQYILECQHCKSKGLKVKIESESLEKIQELWNSRVINDDVYEIGRTNYGYLIVRNGDVIKCNDSHPEEMLKYLGIITDINIEIDCEEICKKIGILRITEHCNCLMIVIPNKINKIQIDKCIELLKNYKSYTNFNIYFKDTVKTFSNVNDCIIELDKVV